MTRIRAGLLLTIFCFVAASVQANLTSSGANSRFTAEERLQGFCNGRVLVKLRDSIADIPVARQSAESRAGVRKRKDFSHLKRQQVLEFDATRPVAEVVRELQATGLYEFVEPDRIVQACVIPSDTSFTQQWALNNTGQSNGTAGADIRAVSGWDILHDAPNVIVAVLDSGIRLNHADLTANLWTNPTPGSSGYSSDLHGINTTVTKSATDPKSGTPEDDDGHGTHVSGIIGAVGNNAIGISGVAWKVQLMALKFLDSTGFGSGSDELACYDYAIAHSAAIINASFGSSGYSRSQFAALQKVRDAGIIMVVAASNDGLSVEEKDTYPAGYALDNIVTVAATTRTDALASYSNFSSGLVDLAAPGTDIYSTLNDTDSAYGSKSGTSMATPHVVGALALLKAKFPGDTYRQLINRLLRSTTKLSALSGKVQSGGRLNLATALASTDSRPFNDDFATKATLTGINVRVRASNIGASAETGEPGHAGIPGSHSLWWTWTAATTRRVVVSTTGSGYDTVLAVYTGSTLGTLQAVSSNDDAASTTTSSTTFNVTAGTTYQIAVDGKAGAVGFTSVQIGPVPDNDLFASAQTVSGVSFSVEGTTLNAGVETGEPASPYATGAHSVWYKWTAPQAGRYQLAAFSWVIDMVASVYTGTAVSSLTLVASNDDSIPSNTDSLVSFNAAAGQTFYFAIDSTRTTGALFTLSLNDSVWQFPTNFDVTSSPAVGSDGTVYFASFDSYVYAVNSDGSKKWQLLTSSPSLLASPAIGPDGTVYVGSDSSYLQAINGSTGTRKWRFTSTSPFSGTPAVGSDGTIYFRDNTALYALTDNGASALKKWSFAFTGTALASPVIGIDGTIYVGAGKTFYAINPDGTQKWKFTTTTNVTTAAAIASDGTLHFGTSGGSLYALKPDGSQRWTWTSASSILSSPVLGADGTVYFGSNDGKLHALNSAGADKWSFAASDEIYASSPAIAADGTIYFGCFDGKVYAVTSAGVLQRTYVTAAEIYSSPVIANGRLYFGSSDAKLYAFNLGQGALASAWPMFQQNALHTGRAVSAASLVTITAQPQSQVVAPSAAFTLSVTATGQGTFTYQWYKDGSALAGANAASYSVASATAANAGSYTVVITNAQGSVTSVPATVAVGTAQTGRLANLSVRAVAGADAQTLIVGFIIGDGSKQLLLRGLGPTLALPPFSIAGTLPDPKLQVFSGQSLVTANENWGDNNGSTTLSAVFNTAGAYPLDAASKDTAIHTTLAAGTYTAWVTGTPGTSGVALAEIFDTDGTNAVGRLANISARANVGINADVMIIGFIISGDVPKKLLIRAIGPALAGPPYNVPGNVLLDPKLEIYPDKATTPSLTNDNWGDNGAATTLSAAFTQSGAGTLSDSNSKDAAVLVTLQPGLYTAVVSGVGNTTGVALVELFEMQ